MKGLWWKLLGVILVCYAIIAGFTVEVPALPILHETIRNLFFHVTMWFGMMILMLVSLIYSIKFLAGSNEGNDVIAGESASVGMLFRGMGLVTGMVWAYYTWGDWWVSDPKLNGAAVTMLVYLAYFVLRGSMEDPTKRAKPNNQNAPAAISHPFPENPVFDALSIRCLLSYLFSRRAEMLEPPIHKSLQPRLALPLRECVRSSL